MWSQASTQIPWERGGNAESQAPPPTHRIRACIFTRSQEVRVHFQFEEPPQRRPNNPPWSGSSWSIFKNNQLSEKATSCRFPPLCPSGKKQNYGGSKTTGGYQDLGLQGRREKSVEHRGFLGQQNDRGWCCDGGYMSLYVCQNPESVSTKSGLKCKLWTLMNHNVSILAPQW